MIMVPEIDWIENDMQLSPKDDYNVYSYFIDYWDEMNTKDIRKLIKRVYQHGFARGYTCCKR